MSLRLHNFGGSMRSHLPASMLASGLHQENDGHALHQPVLVLNASYEPINVCAARRAIVLVLKGVAHDRRRKWTLPARRPCRYACAISDSTAGVSPDPSPIARAVTEEHPAARPQYLPVLQHYTSFG